MGEANAEWDAMENKLVVLHEKSIELGGTRVALEERVKKTRAQLVALYKSCARSAWFGDTLHWRQ